MSEDRLAAIAALVFKRGGVAGAVRRIVFQWNGRFSGVQISIALARKYPLLVPNKYQVQDCLDRMERFGLIQCVVCRHSKLYQRTYEASRFQFQGPVRFGAGVRKQNIHDPIIPKDGAAKDRRSPEAFQWDADQELPFNQGGNLPGCLPNPDLLGRHRFESQNIKSRRSKCIGVR